MDCHQYVIDVHKVGMGDVWEMLVRLAAFNPDELCFDYLGKDIRFEFWGDALDKEAVDELLSCYVDVSFANDDDD